MRISRPREVEEALAALEHGGSSLDERAGALAGLIQASLPAAGGNGRRYADVAGACFALLAAELADARRSLLS